MRIGGPAFVRSALLLAAVLEIALLQWAAVAPRLSGAVLPVAVGWALAVHLRAARERRGHGRRVWIVSTAGLALWVLSLLWHARDTVLANRPESHPSPADALTLLAFVAAVGAMLLMPGVPRTVAGRVRMVLDGVMLAAATFGLVWIAVLDDLVRRPGTDLTDPLTVGFPIAAIVVLSIAALLVAGRRRPGTALTMFCVGVGAACLAVLASSITLMGGSRPDRTGGHGILLLAALLMGAAPYRSVPDRQVEPWDPSTPLARFLPYVPITVFAGFTGYLGAQSRPLDPVLGWTALILVAALFARLLLAVAVNASLARALETHRAEAQYREHHDPLTGLANRALLSERLDRAVVAAGGADPTESAPGPALLLVDLDGFKAVNDSLGHAAGDQVLAAVAKRLRRFAGPDDTVARLGGDEFAVLLARVSGQRGTAAAAQELLNRLAAPLTVHGSTVGTGLSRGPTLGSQPGLGGPPGLNAAPTFGFGPREVTMRASIGAAVADALHRGDSDRLLRDADVALHAAKRDGKGRYRVSDGQLRASAIDQILLDADLRAALVRGEFEVHYQPIIELATGRVSGAEALVRWRHPRRGMVAPSAFLPAAEAAGLLPDMDRWVLREACRQASVWRRIVPDFRVSVNISAPHVTSSMLLGDVTGALNATGLPPEGLMLELTETALVTDTTTAAEVLAELAKLGVRVALDDFGTGYSSLTYLRTLPIHSIKIDRTFVWGSGDGSTNDAVIRALVDLAGTLGLQQVAEGVETDHQAAWLRDLHCTYGQGFHFSHPVPAERMGQILGAHRLGLRTP